MRYFAPDSVSDREGLKEQRLRKGSYRVWCLARREEGGGHRVAMELSCEGRGQEEEEFSVSYAEFQEPTDSPRG